jgi:hypothetical protein
MSGIFGTPLQPTWGSGMVGNTTFSSNSFITENKTIAELSLQQILEKLRAERANFPMYLRKFTNSYFIYSNDVEFQGQLYTVYARRNQSLIADMEFLRCQLPILELKDANPTDCGIMKATSKFIF